MNGIEKCSFLLNRRICFFLPFDYFDNYCHHHVKPLKYTCMSQQTSNLKILQGLQDLI